MKPEELADGVWLYEGDCLEVLPTIAPGSVDAVVTDPPYEITATGGGIVRSRQYLADIHGFTDGGFDYGILNQFDNWACFGTLRQVPKLIEAAGDRRWMIITWNKPDPAPLCNGNYLPDTEYVIHAWRGKALYGDCADKHRYIIHPAGRGGSHPNQKPLGVMRKLVLNASKKGQTILDPFAGSGTTAIAAMKEGRRCILIEKDPRYCEIIRRRVREADGTAPGTLFAKTAAKGLFG